MATQGFQWCPHCGRPHKLDERICFSTGKLLSGVLHVPAPRQLRSPLLGTVLEGKYRILRPIGSGGMGSVFEGEDLAHGRLVAVKVVAEHLTGGATANERLAREAKLMSAVQHPNVCGVYDVGALPNGAPYVVLERLFGETLATHAPLHRRSGLRATVDIFVQVLSGLQAAHDAQIVHRDLKPQNIFLAERRGCPPIVKIVDFGFAQDLSALSAERLTRPGRACGTAQYMSPEQVRAECLDHRSDLFTVGVMLYEALTGRHPFAASSRIDVLSNILRAEPEPLGQRRRDVPVEIERIVASAIAKDPSRRPATAFAMQDALSSAMLQAAPAFADADAEPPSSETGPVFMPTSSSSAA